MATTFNFVYPTATEVRMINQDLVAKSRAERLGFKLLPVQGAGTFNVAWWQKDNDYGIMQYRGLDGDPPRVRQLGYGKFEYEPGVYGEHILLRESELTKRADLLDPTKRIVISDMVLEADRQLSVREDNRAEYNIFTLLSTGVLNIPTPGPNGAYNAYQDSYTIQKYTTGIPFASLASATPIVVFQTLQQLGVGHSGSFGAGSTSYLNQQTANSIINNANANDLDGRRGMYGQTLNNLPAISSYFQGQNLPGLEVYDDGFQIDLLQGPETAPLTSSGATDQFQKYIPNNTMILIGKRPNNEPVGHFQETIVAANNFKSGPYTYVADSFNGINAEKKPNGKLAIHRGFNGGATLEYPYAVIAVTC